VSRPAAVVLAALAGALALPAAAALVFAAVSPLAGRLGTSIARLRRGFDEAVAPLRRAGTEGIDPSRSQRRRLQAIFALGAFAGGWAIADPLAAVALAALSAFLASRAVAARRERYLRRLDQGAAPAALAIADALSTGHSTRGALAIAANALEGPMGVELRRVAADLHVGGRTETALEDLRVRATSRPVDLIVAAIRLQRRSGGNLAALLRDIATTIEEQARLEDEARAASAQARFTSTIVLAMPLFLFGLGELADPGMFARAAGSPLGIWLLGAAALFWLAGAMLVRRLGRISV
jgi:tight adherence protein B